MQDYDANNLARSLSKSHKATYNATKCKEYRTTQVKPTLMRSIYFTAVKLQTRRFTVAQCQWLWCTRVSIKVQDTHVGVKSTHINSY